MKSTKVAARYAKALLELATEQNKVERIAEDMRQLAHVNTEVADFAILLKSPVINSDKKIHIFKILLKLRQRDIQPRKGHCYVNYTGTP